MGIHTKTILLSSLVAIGVVGFGVENLGNETTLTSKPTLDSKIEQDIAKDVQTALTNKDMKSRDIIGTDGVERRVIPYEGPDGKGYIIEYRKTVETVDRNGSSTFQTFFQQVDYGPEGRTRTW